MGVQLLQRHPALYHLLKDWKRYLIILTPIIFLWIPIKYSSDAANCGYVIVIMGVYYMTEALPLPVTALMPVFAFPLFGIISTNDICKVYMKGTAMMFFGGLAAAVAVEHSNLHKRIALYLILKIGQSPRRMMISFMITATFLSMWISNTAATAMMVPILDAILQELYKHNNPKYPEVVVEDMRVSPLKGSQLELVTMRKNQYSATPELEQKPVRRVVPPPPDSERLEPPTEEDKSLSTMYYLATAYASNLGGTGFPTGSGPNLVLLGILESSFPEGTDLTFMTWMLFNIPGMIFCVVLTFIWLHFLYLGCGKNQKIINSSKEKEEKIRHVVQMRYDDLGSITFHEISVLVLFFILVCLWILRAPGFMAGWAFGLQNYYNNGDLNIGNATPAILIIFLFFVIPSKPPWDNDTKDPTPACLTWDALNEKLPWGLIILVGGGFAVSEAAHRSGLSTVIKIQLHYLRVLPGQGIVFLVCIIATFMTEVVSNITAASVLLPVLCDLAIGINMHPLYLLLPATICCSYAFMLPVSNPPNAIVFRASSMTTFDMVKAGFLLKIMSALIITGLINTVGVLVFDLHKFPDWAKKEAINVTLSLLTKNETLIQYLS